MSVTLASYKAKGGLWAWLVRWWTRSSYSHCELIVDGIWYTSSAPDGGVRMRAFEPTEGHWDFDELPWASEELVRKTYRATVGRHYGWIDLIRSQVFNRPGDGGGDFCSEWCAKALGLSTPQQYSPGTLAVYCRARTAARLDKP